VDPGPACGFNWTEIKEDLCLSARSGFKLRKCKLFLGRSLDRMNLQ
jgi:hypothetical protein